AATADIRARLSVERPLTMALRAVENARTSAALRAARYLLHDDAERRIGDVRERASAHDGVDPEELWRLGAELGYRVDVNLAPAHPGAFDVVFRREPDGAALPLLA